MMSIKQLISIMLGACMLLSVASCNTGDDTGSSDGQNEEFIAGNPDWETTYYSTKMITLPGQNRGVRGFRNGDRLYFVATRDIRENGQYIRDEVYLYTCNEDGEVLSENRLEGDEDIVYVSDCCALDDEKFIMTPYSGYYCIYDYNGKLISKDFNDTDTSSRCVCRTDDGFIVGAEFKVIHYDNDGNILDEITIDNTMDGNDVVPVIGVCGVFEQEGEYYAYGGRIDGGDCYFSIDFESGTLEPLFSPGKITPMICMYTDSHRNTIGVNDSTDTIVEINMAQQKAEPLADKKNMLICPPTYGGDDYYPIEALDKTTFIKAYLYPGMDIGVSEIALITPDEELNLKARTPIVIQGPGLSSDSVINSAAYYYNVSQNEYLIKLDDLASRYAFSTPEGMQTTKLQLMAMYNSGEVPDIFYGDFFDFDYMGENDMVMDLSPYLGNDPICGSLRREDGKLYKVYLGYRIKGYFGLSDVYDSDVDITSMPSIPDGQMRFGNAYSPDIIYKSLGIDLCNIYHSGELTYDNVLNVVRRAIEEGAEPDYQYTNWVPPEVTDVGTGKSSLYDMILSNPQSVRNLMQGFRGTPVFVGYPSIGGSIHAFTPQTVMAVSPSTEHLDECIDFIRSMMTLDVQRKISGAGYIPINRDVTLEMIDVLKDPDSADPLLKKVYSAQIIEEVNNDVGHQVPLSDEVASKYLEFIDMADSPELYDWGLWNITVNEVTTYYSQGKSIEEVADALYSRYLVYAQENY